MRWSPSERHGAPAPPHPPTASIRSTAAKNRRNVTFGRGRDDRVGGVEVAVRQEITEACDLGPEDLGFLGSRLKGGPRRPPDLHEPHAHRVGGLKRVLPALLSNDIRHVSGVGGEVVVVYDFVMDTAAGAVPCVKLVTIDGEQLTRVELIFDQKAFAPVNAELARRADMVGG